MSNLSTKVFGDMNYLYEHIANRDAQQLNENSDHYDEEFAELVEDIISTISLSMVHEGYSANGIISFLANSPNEDIIEKYLNFDENVITESTVSEDYIQEQLDQLNEFVGAALRVLGAGLKAAKYAKGVKGLAPVARLSSGLKGAGTAAERVAKQGLKQSSVIRSGLSKGVDKVKDIAKGAKTALTGSTAKKVGLTALGAGALVGLPYAGAKLAGAGSGGQGTVSSVAKPTPQKSPTPQKPPAAPKLPPPSSNSGSGGGSSSPPTKLKASTKPKESDKGPAGETSMQKWARLHPTLASKVKPGQSGYDEISQTRVKPGSYEKQNQTPSSGPEASNAQKSQAGADVAAIQAKERANFEKKNKEVMASTQKESYNAYDLVLEYLFDNGHADTIAEAEYLMTELDESFIQSLVETYEANILAEEVEAWVNELVEEGYDLSEYTWDDMVDHYFSEAKYGTEKGRHELGLKIAHGEDVGKKGGGFENIVTKASKKYGKERATKIAAAAMWKNLGK
jgi:hypothetical protein